MRKIIPIGIVLFSLIIASQIANASSLRCSIKEVLKQSDSGLFDGDVVFKELLDSEIVLDLETGKVFHPFFGNESYTFREILDQGSSVSSFKVIAYSSLGSPRVDGEAGFRNLAMFEVRGYVESPLKPFFAYESGGTVGIGVCQ